jgi:DNA (cytosine-5)-methyltransferase 1
MNYIDLFAGIGGFHLGAQWAELKFENTFYSEVDDYCNKLYKQNFPGSIELGDIKNIDCEKLKKKYSGDWILTGGFPCQDLSIAGQRKGIIKGERSNLWFEYLRIISGIRPRFCIIENVPGLVISGGLGVVLSGLAEIGYNAEWQSISAAEIGAWHKRERIWIIAHPNKLNDDNGRYDSSKICRNGQKKTDISRSKKTLSNSTNKRTMRRKRTQKNVDRQIWRERGKKYFQRWKSEPEICRVVNGIPYRVDRIKGLGNAIVPQIAYLLFLQIKNYIE